MLIAPVLAATTSEVFWAYEEQYLSDNQDDKAPLITVNFLYLLIQSLIGNTRHANDWPIDEER